LLYLDGNAEWQLTDADAATSAAGMLAISLGTAASGGALNVALPGSFVRDDTWDWSTSIGAVLYIDTATAGGMTTSQGTGADDVIRVVGWPISGDVIYFYPSAMYLSHT